MLKLNNFFIYKYHFLYGIFLYKFFSKFVYSKSLLLNKYRNMSKKRLFIVDTFFNFYLFKLKRKYRKLCFFSRCKLGFFLKLDLFIYKHSKLKIYYFTSFKLKKNLRKNIYLDLKNLKNSLYSKNLIFIYKNCRGGFLGFCNKVIGFVPKKIFEKNLIIRNVNIKIYKKYFILYSITMVPYFFTNYSTFFSYQLGFIRNFSVKKKKLRRFFFKRFNFVFLSQYFYLKKYLIYFLQNFNFFKLKFFKKKKLNIFFLSVFLKIFNLL